MCSNQPTSYPITTRHHAKYNIKITTRVHKTQLFYSSMDFVRDNLGKLIPEERNIHPLTPFVVISHPLSVTIHSIFTVQFTCLTVFFHNLSPSFLWSTSWSCTIPPYSVYFFIQSLSSFRSTCPYHCNLF